MSRAHTISVVSNSVFDESSGSGKALQQVDDVDELGRQVGLELHQVGEVAGRAAVDEAAVLIVVGQAVPAR